MVEFFQTVMGKAFYEGTMPAIVRELKTLNNHLSQLVVELQKMNARKYE